MSRHVVVGTLNEGETPPIEDVPKKKKPAKRKRKAAKKK